VERGERREESGDAKVESGDAKVESGQKWRVESGEWREERACNKKRRNSPPCFRQRFADGWESSFPNV